MKLIGTQPSPYVRRFRILLAGSEFEFQPMDVYADEDRAILEQQNPANRVPVIIDGEQVVYESRVIFRYLQQKLDLPVLSWEQENRLSLIDALQDSYIVLLLSKRSGFDVSQDKLIYKLQNDRINNVLPALEQDVKDGKLADWDYLAISLFTVLDWVQFRDVWDLSPYPALVNWLQENQSSKGVAETDPRG
jgi:glutathione S-transferase